MLRAIRLSKRAQRALVPAVAAALTAAIAAAAAVVSCIAVAPAGVPQLPAEGPIIVQSLVTPPPGEVLRALPPQGFLVPVTSREPTLECRVFIDFDTGKDNFQYATPPAFQCKNDTAPVVDGGLTDLRFSLTAENLGDPTVCHVIQFFVADVFASNASHTPGDDLGADSVSWQYAPDGLGGCFEVDGGDGEFPEDAPIDGLPFVPDAVGSPR